MPSNQALLRAYGQLLIPGRIDEMTYQEAVERGFYKYDIRVDLLKLYERDCQTINSGKGEEG